MSDPSYVIGVDLGQAADYTALAVDEIVKRADGGWQHRIRHLERFPLGTSYPDQVRVIESLAGRRAVRAAPVVVDQTGVGRAVVDQLRESSVGSRLVGVQIHGGDRVHQEEGTFRVPKRDLVSVLQVLLQTGRLQIAEKLPAADILVEELLGFRVKVSAAGRDSYEAWREGVHDDMVLAVALGSWYAERFPPTVGRVHGVGRQAAADLAMDDGFGYPWESGRGFWS